MSLQDNVRAKMYEAMKSRDKQAKDAYSMVLDQLKKREIDTRKPLTETEEIEVISRMVKQTKESIESLPLEGNEDFVSARQFELDIYTSFLPKQLNEQEIEEVIRATMAECDIDILTNQNKGILMKNLMPKVKGKADGKLVSQIVARITCVNVQE